jgi:type I restriction enzyme R subunit
MRGNNTARTATRASRLFEFKRRTLVHFTVDRSSIHDYAGWRAARRISCRSTKRCDGGSGQSTDPQGRTYRTAYLWKRGRNETSFLDLLARFLHPQIEERRTEDGRKVKAETMIFPRYHQLQAVRQLERRA